MEAGKLESHTNAVIKYLAKVSPALTQWENTLPVTLGEEVEKQMPGFSGQFYQLCLEMQKER